jgi:hypothetical protein
MKSYSDNQVQPEHFEELKQMIENNADLVEDIIKTNQKRFNAIELNATKMFYLFAFNLMLLDGLLIVKDILN